jgi:hypothetical protein
MFKTSLKINGKKIVELDLRQDNKQNKNNTFAVRRWLPAFMVTSGDKISVIVTGDDGELSNLELKPVTERGKQVLTAKKDTGEIYSWATLTDGYSNTKGLTSGIMFRRKKTINDLTNDET